MSSTWTAPRLDRPHSSLSDQVYQSLKDAILDLMLPPSSILVEAELADSFGTSATPVREAIRRLRSEGLVEITYARSAVVRGLALEDIEDLYQVRALLESWAVREGVAQMGKIDIELLEAINNDAELAMEKGDLAGFSKKNNEFHLAMSASAGNKYLTQVLGNIADQLHRVRVALAKSDENVARKKSTYVVKEHREIIEALRARNPEQAEKLVYADITTLLKEINNGSLDRLIVILDPS